jgi:nucleoid-associated protein YgaU
MSNYGGGYNQDGYQQGGHQQQHGYGQDSYVNHNNDGGHGQQPHHQQQPHHGQASSYYNDQASPQSYGQAPMGGPGGHGQEGFGQEPPQYQQYPSAAAHSSNSGRNSHNQGYQNQYAGEGDPEGDRGIMGGLAGGAAGAYGGHTLGGKAGHGTAGMLAGALAGAFAGHKGQDAASEKWDEHKNKKKEEEDRKKWEEEEERRRKYGQQGQSPFQSQSHGGNNLAGGQMAAHQQDRGSSGRQQGDFGGNFTASSRDIRLDAHGEYTLHAQCRKPDGSYQASSIALNRYLENDGGSFRWSSGSSSGGGGENTYTVQQGDTLRAISGRFSHCTYDELARHNNISNPDQIWPGQNLRIPGGNSSRGGGGFSGSARNARLDQGGQQLEAELEHGGRWALREINLDERISNQGGSLVFV